MYDNNKNDEINIVILINKQKKCHFYGYYLEVN